MLNLYNNTTVVHLILTSFNINKQKYDAELVIIVCSDPMPYSWRNKVAVGTTGLLLGPVFVVAGLIYYKKKSTGER